MGRHRRLARARRWPLALVLGVVLATGFAMIYMALTAAGKPLAAPVPDAPFDSGTPADPTTQWAPPPAELAPNTLAIPDLNILASIVSTGFSSTGSMVLPPPSRISHLDNDVAFGSPEGTNLVAGHVDDGDRTPGAMWALHQIKPGTPIYVTDAGGTLWTYRATSLTLYEKVALPPELFTSTGAPHLVLVTCGGETVPDPYLPSGFTYKDNIVVTAVPA